jgi:hypothetical protein
MKVGVSEIYLDEPTRREIGDLVLKANSLRNEAWEEERTAITQLEHIVELGDKTINK